MAHLISLRRHDPDQVRWVGLGRPLSPASAGHPKRLLLKYLVRAGVQRKAALPGTRVFAGLDAHDLEKHVLDSIGDGNRFSDKIIRK
jgi:hypothetical protein